MKLWELSSACRNGPGAINEIADSADWSEYYEWLQNVDELIRIQDRSKLDYELPDDLCRAVLAKVRSRYNVSDGYVHSTRPNEPGELSAVEVFDLYGGAFLENVNEYGSSPIPAS